MLTLSDLRNIKNFATLEINHQRVFKHRLMNKCRSAIKDIDFLLLHYELLDLKVKKMIDVNELKKMLETYEEVLKLQ